MRFKSKITYSWVASSMILIGSILFPIIPCQIGANVPNPRYSWSICRLSPDLMKNMDLKTFFFGYTGSMTESYFILLVLVFIITFGILHIATRKQKN